MSNTSSANESLEVKVLTEFLKLKPEIYTNFVNRPCIRLPLVANVVGRAYGLYDDRVRSEISEFSWRQCKGFLREQQLSSIIRVLKGLALKDIRCDPDLEDALDEDPLLEGINIYMRLSKTNGRYRGSCTRLLSELNGIADSCGVDSSRKLWPKGPSQLSRRIGELKSLLDKAGIHAEGDRNPGGARVMCLKLSKLDDDGAKAAS